MNAISDCARAEQAEARVSELEAALAASEAEIERMRLTVACHEEITRQAMRAAEHRLAERDAALAVVSKIAAHTVVSSCRAATQADIQRIMDECEVSFDDLNRTDSAEGGDDTPRTQKEK